MDNLALINRWLSKQHVVAWCVAQGEDIWCSNAFYWFSPDEMALYILSDEKSRHGVMAGVGARIAGTISGQPKTVALIRGVQFGGYIRPLAGAEAEAATAHYYHRFPMARALKAPVWEIRLDEIKFTDNTLGFGKKIRWQREL